MLRFSLAASALAAFLATATPSLADEIKMPRTISLSGHGEVKATPDMATVMTGVMTQGATAAEALAANTTAMTSLFAALKGAGIAEKDMQTSNFMIQPRYDYNDGKQPPVLVGYDVSNTVTVTVRQIDSLGALLDTVVKAGSNQINGISFDVSTPTEGLDEARKLAAADATRKAKLYAETLGVTLGPVLSISEGVSYQPPVPMLRTAAAPMADSARPVPVAAGEQTLAMDVNITWEIQ
jgi:uncharacterized protein YggE